jgi:GNAT superfamily N-acetyltransferase
MPAIDDIAEIRALLETDRPWSVYALGDLSPKHAAFCTWLRSARAAPALALLYRGFTPPVLFTLGAVAAVAELLHELEGEPAMHLHVRPEVVPLLEARYQVRHEKAMWRMLLDPVRFQPPPAGETTRLGPGDLSALEQLYADGESTGESPEFFSSGMLLEGVYYGVWEGNELAAAAGTHLVVPAEGVGAIGNVYTRRDRRRRGLAGRVTGAVTAELLGRGLRTVALNVEQGNEAVARVYERLGFSRYCPFVEGLAVRR